MVTDVAVGGTMIFGVNDFSMGMTDVSDGDGMEFVVIRFGVTVKSCPFCLCESTRIVLTKTNQTEVNKYLNDR